MAVPRLSSDVSEIKLVFSIPPDRATPNVAPSWNVAPINYSSWSAIIRGPASAAWMSCSGGSCRFGLRTSKVGFANINAKAEEIEGRPALREAFQPPGSLVPVDVFTNGRRPGRGSNPVKTLRVLTSRDLWGNQVGSDQPSAERHGSSSFTRILILIIAADSPIIHSGYVGKTTGPATMLAANRLVGRSRLSQKDQTNRVVMLCLFFGQISKNLSNRS